MEREVVRVAPNGSLGGKDSFPLKAPPAPGDQSWNPNPLPEARGRGGPGFDAITEALCPHPFSIPEREGNLWKIAQKSQSSMAVYAVLFPEGGVVLVSNFRGLPSPGEDEPGRLPGLPSSCARTKDAFLLGY